jgi:NAD(P)-dependent dehydrogenase (short-subunit alcohol dehydrogenase family)
VQDLKGKTAYVSGAASGIGFGIAAALAQAGAYIAMVDIRAEALADARARLHNLGARVETFVADVSDAALLEETAAAIDKAFGPIHIVCNNAGVSMLGVPLEDIPRSDWDWVIDVNINGVINGIRTFVPRMRRHGEGGHIVNTASIAGLQVNPNFKTGAYAMTKYAVVALSEALEQELAGSGIGVSVLCPAAVDTGIHLSARARPQRLGGPFTRSSDHFMGDLIREGLRPEQVGARVVQAIRDGEFYILTHSTPREWVERRFKRIMAAFDRAEAFEKKLGITPWRLDLTRMPSGE